DLFPRPEGGRGEKGRAHEGRRRHPGHVGLQGDADRNQRASHLHAGRLMRALVLAGGEGSRLRPITHTSAKQLIPIANTPILFHALEAIREAGITEVGIVVGSTAAEVEAAVGDGSRWGLRVAYIPQAKPLGIADAVRVATDFVAGEPFLLYLGDNVLLEG